MSSMPVGKKRISFRAIVLWITVTGTLAVIGVAVYQESIERDMEENCDAWIAGTYYETSDFEEAVMRRRCKAKKLLRPPVVVHCSYGFYGYKEDTGIDGKIHVYCLAIGTKNSE